MPLTVDPCPDALWQVGSVDGVLDEIPSPDPVCGLLLLRFGPPGQSRQEDRAKKGEARHLQEGSSVHLFLLGRIGTRESESSKTVFVV